MHNEGLPEGIRIVLKFSKETKIHLQEGQFISSEGNNISSINERLNRESELKVYPLFDLPAENNPESTFDEQLPDLSRYYVIVVQDTDTAERLCNELNRMWFVEEAYIEPPTYLAV
jgi:hypothetical protein